MNRYTQQVEQVEILMEGDRIWAKNAQLIIVSVVKKQLRP